MDSVIVAMNMIGGEVYLKRSKLRIRESEVQSAVMDFLAVYGIFALRLNTGTFRVGSRYVRAHSGGAGVSDILAFPLRGGHCLPLWIECKSDIGEQTAEQASFQAFVESKGHRYVVVRSQDDLVRALSQLTADAEKGGAAPANR